MKWFVLCVQKRLPLCEKVSVVTAGAWLLSASWICPHHGLAQYFEGGRKGRHYIFSLQTGKKENGSDFTVWSVFNYTGVSYERKRWTTEINQCFWGALGARRGFHSNSCTRGHRSLECIVYIVRASKRAKSSVMGVGLLPHEKLFSLSPPFSFLSLFL